MQRLAHLAPRFVEAVPEGLEPGLLYVSIPYGTVVHLCCCGCGEEVVTPLTPTDWRMTYDGEQVSLHPSVGSWTLPCRSHYVVARGEVRWAKAWTERQIAEERSRDRAAKAEFYQVSRSTLANAPVQEQQRTPVADRGDSHGIGSRLVRRARDWLRSLWPR